MRLSQGATSLSQPNKNIVVDFGCHFLSFEADQYGVRIMKIG